MDEIDDSLAYKILPLPSCFPFVLTIFTVFCGYFECLPPQAEH